MNQRQKPKPKKRRGATAAAVLSFVAAIAIVGTYTFRDYRESQREDQLAQAEETENTDNMQTEEPETSEETNTDMIVNTEDDPLQEEAEEEEETEEETQDAQENASQSTAGGAAAANFTSESQLLWPVDGNVLLSYSMDKTVYFSTLDQYKYNPALIISGAEGDQVISAAPGTVKSIDQSAETGTTVNVDLGNGYELFYGQLKEVPVKVGDTVEAKTVLGYVSQPTKYYSVEGCNVYFEMRKDGQPVNPMEYLVE